MKNGRMILLAALILIALPGCENPTQPDDGYATLRGENIDPYLLWPGIDSTGAARYGVDFDVNNQYNNNVPVVETLIDLKDSIGAVLETKPAQIYQDAIISYDSVADYPAKTIPAGTSSLTAVVKFSRAIPQGGRVAIFIKVKP